MVTVPKMNCSGSEGLEVGWPEWAGWEVEEEVGWFGYEFIRFSRPDRIVLSVKYLFIRG